MIPNQLNRSSMFGDAEGMILHARAAANISQDEDLDCNTTCILFLLVSGRTESVRENEAGYRDREKSKANGPQHWHHRGGGVALLVS